MTPAGLEPAIPGSVGRCLIHWATGPVDEAKIMSSSENKLIILADTKGADPPASRFLHYV